MVIRFRGILGLLALLVLIVFLSLAVPTVTVMQHRAEPGAVEVPPGYAIDVVARDLNMPTDIDFDAQGVMYVAESGAEGLAEPRVLRLGPQGERQVLVTGLAAPVLGVTVYRDALYVSHRGRISSFRNGVLKDLVVDLPSLGDHSNNRVAFGPDGKMYFGQGTATNSGVAGLDNLSWLATHPDFRDTPSASVTLTGQNFVTENPLPSRKGRPTTAPGEAAATPGDSPATSGNPPATSGKATTGAFVPFNTPTVPGQVIPAGPRPNGAVMRANPDGTGLEVLAWGFRNPYGLQFAEDGRLWVTNQGMGEIGSRPIADAVDEFHEVKFWRWYGWPDFSAGEPVTAARFAPQNGPAPRFLMARHPSDNPPRPFATFPPHSAASQFDLSPGGDFGFAGDALVALSGDSTPSSDPRADSSGSRVVRVNMRTGTVHDFMRNRLPGPASESQGHGLERPRAARFGPDGALYVVDFGVIKMVRGRVEPVPGTGVIWRVTKAPPEKHLEGRAVFPFIPLMRHGRFLTGLVAGVLLGLGLSRFRGHRRA